MPHNELVNVWTHLLGAIVIAIILVFFYIQMISAQNVAQGQDINKGINTIFQNIYSQIPQQ